MTDTEIILGGQPKITDTDINSKETTPRITDTE